MTLPGWIRHRRLSLKVVVAILLVSSLVTLVITSIQLYAEYRRDLHALDQTLSDARGSFAGPWAPASGRWTRTSSGYSSRDSKASHIWSWQNSPGTPN